MYKAKMPFLFLLVGHSIYTAQMVDSELSAKKEIRLNQIKNAASCPSLTMDDIKLFIGDDKGAMVKRLVLEDDQCKNKKICIDFTERSRCEKITDKINYLAPRGLTYIAIDLANSQIDGLAERILSLGTCVIISSLGEEYVFSRIKSYNSLDRKISKIFPKNFFPTLYYRSKQGCFNFQILIEFVLDAMHSTVSVLVAKYLCHPILLVKILAGTILTIRTIGILNFYNNICEESDSIYKPIITLEQLVNSFEFTNQCQK